jgi:hypothetical protein
MTVAEAKRQHRRLMRDIEHRVWRAGLKRKIAEFREKEEDLRRTKERYRVDDVKKTLDMYRDSAARSGAPIPLDVLEAHHRHVTADIARPGTEALVRLWQSHADELAQQYRLTVTWGVYRAANAYAWPKLRRVDASPLVNAENYADFLHEAGHVAVLLPGCNHKGGPCVRCEIESWRWAISQARPSWSIEMHHEMGRCLPTYRKHATPSQAREIDVLVSRWTYYEARQARARRTA